MKFSKQLPLWLRNRRWSIYVTMNPLMRKRFGIRNFESFCKVEINSHIYNMTLQFKKHSPKLKSE